MSAMKTRSRTRGRVLQPSISNSLLQLVVCAEPKSNLAAPDRLVARAERILAIDIEYPASATSAETSPSDDCLDLRETGLLDARQEADLFRRMNSLKYRADAARRTLNASTPSPSIVTEVERLLEEARRIRNHLAVVFMKLAASVARGFVGPEFPFDDLVSEGHTTLLRAIEKFDPARGFRFSTYATHAIRRNLCRYITRQRTQRQRVLAVECPESLVDDRRWTWQFESKMETANAHLRKMLSSLAPREQSIVESRFAVGDGLKPQTLQSIADEMGISRERVRQLEQRALSKLRVMANQQQLQLPA